MFPEDRETRLWPSGPLESMLVVLTGDTDTDGVFRRRHSPITPKRGMSLLAYPPPAGCADANRRPIAAFASSWIVLRWSAFRKLSA